MKAEIFTKTELKVYQLLLSMMGSNSTDTSGFSPNDAGNKIIEFAEQIKAERAVASMYPELPKE